jgi:hypothetical protein
MRIATVKRLRTLASIQEYKNLHPGAIGVWAYWSATGVGHVKGF